MRRGSIHGVIAQQHNAYKLTALQLNENDIEKANLDVLKVRGYFAVRIHSGTFRSADCKRWIKGADKSTPDYVAVHARYRGFLLETKRPGAKLTTIQKFRVFEILRGYRLAFIKADSARELSRWIDHHDRIHETQQLNRRSSD